MDFRAIPKVGHAYKSPGDPEILLSTHSDSASLGWDLGFCIFSQCPDDTDAADQRTELRAVAFRACDLKE